MSSYNNRWMLCCMRDLQLDRNKENLSKKQKTKIVVIFQKTERMKEELK